MRAPFQEGDFPFPVKYGYCAVGIAEEVPKRSAAGRSSRSIRTRTASWRRPPRSRRCRRAFPPGARFWPPTWKRRSTPCGIPAPVRGPRPRRRRGRRRLPRGGAGGRHGRHRSDPRRRRPLPPRRRPNAGRRVRKTPRRAGRSGCGVPCERQPVGPRLCARLRGDGSDSGRDKLVRRPDGAGSARPRFPQPAPEARLVPGRPGGRLSPPALGSRPPPSQGSVAPGGRSPRCARYRGGGLRGPPREIPASLLPEPRGSPPRSAFERRESCTPSRCGTAS